MDKNPSTILIVDDEPAMCEALGELLAEEGYLLSFAQSGEEGLAKAAEIVPDLILLDVVMPDMDGFTVCRKLRADEVLANVPIIMTTSLADRDSRLRGFAVGADDYVTKPVDEPELLARVRTTTRLNRYRRLLEEQIGREMAEEALDISETRYRSLFDNIPVGLYRSTLDGQILEANPALVEMLGYPDVEAFLATNAIDEYIDPLDRQRWQAMIEQEGIVRGFETLWRRYDGTTIWVRESSRVVRDEKGQVLYYEGAMEDITERKRAEEELQKREAHQALVLGSLPMAFYTARPFGDYGGTWVSDQIEQIAGFTTEQFLEDTHLWAARLHPKDRDRALDAFEKLPDTETLEIEYRWQAADGRYVWLLDHAVLVRDGTGKLREIIGTWLDITERKQAEEALQNSLQQASHSQVLLLALSEAAQAVQRARTPQEVYQTIGEEIAKLGYRAAIFDLTEDEKHLTVGHMTFESKLVKAAEKLVGLSAQDYRVRLTPGGFYEHLIAEGEPIFSDPGGPSLNEALPKVAHPLANKLADLFGLHQAIYVPLKIGARTHALLVVMGADLTEDDTPAMTAFANQAAIAVTNAQLYQAANQERDKAQQYLDIAGVMLVAINAKGEITLINRKGCDILGCEEDKILGENWFESCLPTDIRKNVRSVFDQLIAGEVEPAEYYENPVVTATGEERLIAWHNTVLRDGEGNIVGTLSSGEDITERAQAEKALRESEENYRSVVDNANVGIVVIQEGKLVFHNARMPEMLSYSEEEYQQVDFTATIHPDNRELALGRIRKRVRGEEIGSEGAEIRLITKSGETRWVQANSSVIHWEGKPAIQAFVSDITERVRSEQERTQAQAALQESEEKYRNVIEHAHEAIVVVQDDLLKFFNPQTVNLTGYSLEELASISLAELIHPDDRTAGIARQQRRLAGEDIPPIEVVRIIDKQGNVKWVENNAIVITWEDEPAMLHFVNDITERVRSEQERAEAEEALRQSEEKFRSVVEQASDGILLTDEEGYISEWNQAQERITGISRAEVLGRPIWDTQHQLAPEENRDQALYERIKTSQLALLETGRSPWLDQLLEHEIQRPDGTHRTLQAVAFPVKTEKGFIVGSVSRDITEQKQAEAAMHIQRDLGITLASTSDLTEALHQVLEAAMQIEGIDCGGAYLVDRLTGQLDLMTHHGLSPQFIERTSHYAADAPQTRIIMAGKPVHQRYDRVVSVTQDPVRQDEGLRALSVIPIQYEGQVVAVLNLASHTHDEIPSSACDALEAIAAQVGSVLARIEAEEALRESEETARALLNATNDLAILIAPGGDILASNEMAARAAGIDIAEMLGANIEDFLSPDLLEIGTAQADQVRRSSEAIRFQAKREGATLDISIYPVFDAQGELARFSVFARDITEQIKTRQAIEQRSRELAALNEIGQAVISTLDLQEMLTLIAEHTNQLMGMAATSIVLREEADDGLYFAAASGEGADAIVGQRLAIDQGIAGWVIQHGKPVLIPDVSKDARWYGSLDAQTGFSTRSLLCVPLKSKERTIGALEALNKPEGFTQDDLHLLNTLAAPVATAIENARLFKEVRVGREQLQSLSRRLVEMQEAERAHVARELHDETGQALSGMLLSLSLLEQEADQPKAVKDRTSELLVLVDDMLDNLHRLAMNLRPATLDHLGLLPTLEQFVETFEEQYNIETQFEVVGLGSDRLPPEMETALYRIVQESLTNVARHAQATRVDVLVARRDDQVVTIVEDNGSGFDSESAMQTSRMGLLGMRERAEMLNGRLVIESVPGSGTTVLVEVPYQTVAQ